MGNILLAYRNRADECTLSGGSWAAALPLANLQNRDIHRVARTADALAASTQFVAALPSLRAIRAVGLINTNASLDAQYRVSVATDAGFTAMVHDSGVLDVFPAGMYDTLALDWEDPRFWDGRPIAEDVQYFSSDIIYPLPAIALGQYVKVEITDTANGDGYFEIGRLFVGEGWQPAKNMSYGAGIAPEDLSTIDATKAGKEFFTERDVRRSLRFELKWLSTGEGARVQDLQRTAKTIGEVLAVWDPDDLVNVKRRSFLGRLRQLGALEWPFPSTNSVPFELQEIL